ncbi:Rnase Y domain-containing protein, partial [Salibacteraceae bacterium]|nr:Rnase Y domain-containing protein [Salibacteraceae bacterium]
MDIISIVIGLLPGAVAGAVGANIMLKKSSQQKANHFLEDAKAEAEVVKKDKILQAKEKFLQLKSEHEKTINEKNNKMTQAENRIRQKEESLNK